MLSHHDGDSRERDVIVAALSSMRQVTDSINELKRQQDRLMRASEIRRLMDGWTSVDLALLGPLVMEV